MPMWKDRVVHNASRPSAQHVCLRGYGQQIFELMNEGRKEGMKECCDMCTNGGSIRFIYILRNILWDLHQDGGGGWLDVT